jgi:hypothetical protein
LRLDPGPNHQRIRKKYSFNSLSVVFSLNLLVGSKLPG